MFVRLPDAAAGDVALTIDGTPVVARSGDSVAAAIVACGRLACRTNPVSGASRGPYCLMGACFDCSVTIDGAPNRRACLVTVAAGMQVETGLRERSS